MKRIRSVAVLLAAIFAMEKTAYAQVDTGTILGAVKDQAGAVVPGVKVTLTNEGTGNSIEAVTRTDSSYVFAPVRVGVYTVAASFPVFETSKQLHVEMNVQQQVAVDFSLHPGQVTETVEVTAVQPLLQTQNGSVGQVVASKQINDLPLNGRNSTFLAQLASGQR
jgi:hypothetical protein